MWYLDERRATGQITDYWPVAPRLLEDVYAVADAVVVGSLLITLLKAIGIQANEVLVQTRYTAQPSLLRASKAAIPLFDHGIAYLPGEKGKPGIWLDATSPESRLGPLPSMDARTVAFFIDEGPAKVIDTPASSPDEHELANKFGRMELVANG